MDTLIIEVNCRPPNRNGPPQLGITVEAPYLVAYHQQQRLQQQQQAKEYRNHDYQNFHMPHSNGTTTTTKAFNDNKSNNNNNHHHKPMQQNQNGTTSKFISSSSVNKHNNITGSLSEQFQRGLQITQIQKNSVIDLNGQFKIGDIVVEVNGVDLQRRTFQDAQTTLKEFVKQSSHCPLQLKVLRKLPSASSSSSLPSTTGSQATVIERDVDLNDDLSPISNNMMTATTKIPGNRLKSNTLINSTSTPSPQSFNGARHFAGALNTRKIGAIINVKLTKSNDGGFGIKIAERDNMFGSNRPIYITAITTTGAAFRDGRLREGDMLLEVNGIDLSGKSQPEVTKMLKSVNVNESVEFVVSRPQTEDHNNINQLARNQVENNPNTDSGYDNNKSLIDLDAPEDLVFTDSSNHQFEKKIDSIFNVPNLDGPGAYVYDIPLNDTKSAGLGLYLKYPTLDRRDLGIWIEKVITGGAAWKDGRLQPDDQILAINGINLMGLSNGEASETLMAAVCRGIGPEVTPDTIRLNIHRRDPSVVAKILHGTNNRIEHSDLPTNGHNKSYSINEKMMNNTTDSYRTAFDNTLHSRSQTSSDTSKSSNQNSQTDSALSPQTQASNSLKLTNSCNDKSDPNSSDKTNDTSSAISQITDFTTVPLMADNNISPVKDSNISNDNNQAFITLPKTLDISEMNVQDVDPALSVQSWDDDSIDAATGEERFQRDGFGRQSISEKRHAQLMAKNTDTYKRNQKLREERDKQRQAHENFERMRLDDFKRHSLNPNIISSNQQSMIVNSSTLDDINQMYVKPMPVLANDGVVDSHLRDNTMNYQPREVPVNVQVPVELGIGHRNDEIYNDHARLFYSNNNNNNLHYQQQQQQQAHIINSNDYNRMSNPVIGIYGHHQNQHHQILPNQMSFVPPCWKCGSVIPCLCNSNSIDHFQRNPLPQPQTCNIYPGYNTHMVERSNSLESIQHHLHNQQNPMLGGPMIPRAGTVRVARNRRINESFRAAVDRSYKVNINDTGRYNYAMNDRSDSSIKISGSIAKSNSTSVPNDERINSHSNGSSNSANNNTSQHKKSSSLLTKFLKFGSMKEHKSKRRNLNTNIASSNQKPMIVNASTSNDINSMYVKPIPVLANGSNLRNGPMNYQPREVPVDVQVPVELGTGHQNNEIYNDQARLFYSNNNHHHHLQQQQQQQQQQQSNIINNNDYNRMSNQVAGIYGHHQNQHHQNQILPNQLSFVPPCWKCGSVAPCLCNSIDIGHFQRNPQHQAYNIHPGYNTHMVERSNSLESIQHHLNNQQNPLVGGPTIPRAGTVRVARNRKINESFRAAVDRSYKVNINDTGRYNYAMNDRSDSSTKMSGSIAKSSSTSASNDERINSHSNGSSNSANNNTSQHKKSSSLLTKFLKFGSIKRKEV